MFPSVRERTADMNALRWVSILFVLFLFAPLLLPAQSIRCTLCGKKISGRYLVSDGKADCSQRCFDRTLPRCATCGKILRDNRFQYKNRQYCSIDCMKPVLPKCDSCHQPIAGKYGVYPTPMGEKRVLCHHCSRLPRCFACELPGKGARLPDGRRTCASCAKESIRDPEEAERLFQEVRERTEKLLGEEIRCPLRLRLVDEPTLRAVTNLPPDKNTIELGYCRSNMLERKGKTISEIIGYRCEVYLLDSLPRWRFREIAAHELAHHWQYHAAPYLRDRVMQEGFAEYMASLVNREFGQENLNARIEQRRDPVYGAGFRKIRSVARREGIEGVKKMLRDAGKNAAGASR